MAGQEPWGGGRRRVLEIGKAVTYQKYHSRWMERARTQHREPQQSSYGRHLRERGARDGQRPGAAGRARGQNGPRHSSQHPPSRPLSVWWRKRKATVKGIRSTPLTAHPTCQTTVAPLWGGVGSEGRPDTSGSASGGQPDDRPASPRRASCSSPTTREPGRCPGRPVRVKTEVTESQGRVSPGPAT